MVLSGCGSLCYFLGGCGLLSVTVVFSGGGRCL